jgi:hypothetical protein
VEEMVEMGTSSVRILVLSFREGPGWPPVLRLRCASCVCVRRGRHAVLVIILVSGMTICDVLLWSFRESASQAMRLRFAPFQYSLTSSSAFPRFSSGSH